MKTALTTRSITFLAMLAMAFACAANTQAAETYTRSIYPLGNGFGITSVVETQPSTDSRYATRNASGSGICSAYDWNGLKRVNGALLDYGYVSSTDQSKSYNDIVGFYLTYSVSDPDTINVWRNLTATMDPYNTGNIRSFGFGGVSQGSSLLAFRLDGYSGGIAGNALGTIPVDAPATTNFYTYTDSDPVTAGDQPYSYFNLLVGGSTVTTTWGVGPIGGSQDLVVSSSYANYLGRMRMSYTGGTGNLAPHGQFLTGTNIAHRGSPAINDTCKVIAAVTTTEPGDPTPETDEWFRLRVIKYTDDGTAGGFSKISENTYSFRNPGDGNRYAFTNFYSSSSFRGPQQISINDHGDIAFPVVINVHDYDYLGSSVPYRTCPRIGVMFMHHSAPGVFKLAVDNKSCAPTMAYTTDVSSPLCIGGVSIDNDCNIYFSAAAWAGVWQTGTGIRMRTNAIFKATANDPANPTMWSVSPMIWRGCAWKEGEDTCHISWLPVGGDPTSPGANYATPAAFASHGLNRTALPGKTHPRYDIGGLFTAAGVDVSSGFTTTTRNRGLYVSPTEQAPSAGSIASSKLLADNEPVNLHKCLVTSDAGTYTSTAGQTYYRWRVTDASGEDIVVSTIRNDLPIGARVSFSGFMKTNTEPTDPNMTMGERWVLSTGLVQLRAPIAMNTRAVGGDYGLNTGGMWVRVFGAVSAVNTADKYIEISDGGATVKVSYADYAAPVPSLVAGDYVTVTGIVAPGPAGAPKTVLMENGDELVKKS